MSAHAEAVHGRRAPRAAAGEPRSRLDPTTLGMFLFIASEAMLFGAFFTAYFFVRVVNPDAPATWPPPPYEFPVFVASVNTAILVTSSFTIHWATQSIKRGDRNGLKAGLVVTILLGAAFLLTQPSSTRTSASTRATAPLRRSSSASRACTARTSSSACRS